MNPAIEERFVQSFVVPDRRERWAEQLRGKRRMKQLDRLYHHFEFQAGSVTKLKLAGQEDLLRILEAKGCPKICYVISANQAHDGQTVALAQFLGDHWPKPMGCVIVCDPEKLVVFCDEYDAYLMENKS